MKQALDECEFRHSISDVAEEISKGFVIGEPLSLGYDGVDYEGKRAIRDLRIQIQALASAEFQMLLGFVEKDLDIPADLVKFKSRHEVQFHIRGCYHFILGASSISDGMSSYSARLRTYMLQQRLHETKSPSLSCIEIRILAEIFLPLTVKMVSFFLRRVTIWISPCRKTTCLPRDIWR